MAATMTTPKVPGERRPGPVGPTVLDRPPSDRYLPRDPAGGPRPTLRDRVAAPLGVAVGGIVAYVLLGGVLALTAGLIVVAGLIGWLMGLVVRPPLRAAGVAVAVVAVGLLGIWLFGRWEGGVLDPLDYLAEVHGLILPLELAAAGGMAAAASR
jgi:hypothetical protein